MARPSPPLQGFRVIFSRPSFGLAEIAWRWSFAAAASFLLGFSFFEYLDTLPVSPSDLLLLQTAQPALISRAVQHIFRGSAWRVMETAAVLALTLGIAWVVVASLGRAATIRALLDHFHENNISKSSQPDRKQWRLRSLLMLNSFRFATTLAAIVGSLAAVLLGRAASAPDAPAPALLIILTIALMIWLAWSTLNWFLSLAGIFVVADGEDTFGALGATVNLCRTRPGPVFAVGTWFGLAHIAAFAVASSVVAFPLGLASLLPGEVVLGGVLLITLLYFALADFLYVGRLGAYLAIIEMPPAPAIIETAPPTLPSSAIDASELILSDLPAGS
jgi:hypothetical protein